MRPCTILSVACLTAQYLVPGPAHAFDQEDPADRLWQVHIFGEDDRGLSSYPFVGMVSSRRIRGEFSAFLCSRKNAVTVAHGFADAGNWGRTKSEQKPSPREFGDYSVRVEGCHRTYRVDDVAVATTNTDLEYWKDYAVLTLEEDICPAVEIPQIGLSSKFRDLEVPPEGLLVDLDEDIAVVGYYRPGTVQKPTSRAALPDPRYETTTSPGSLRDLKRTEQYAAVGQIFGVSVHHGELYLWHYVDATFGGSGGPLVVDAEGRTSVIGMHTSGGDKGNHSIAAQGPFLEFMREHCDGLVEAVD